MTTIAISEATPGMYLQHEVVGPDKLTLLAGNTKLTDGLIKTLIKKHITEIDVVPKGESAIEIEIKIQEAIDHLFCRLNPDSCQELKKIIATHYRESQCLSRFR